MTDHLREIPIELRGATPRSVRLTGTGWANALAASLFFGLGSTGAAFVVRKVIVGSMNKSDLWSLAFPVGLAIFGLLFIRRFPSQRRLAIEGIVAGGTVSEREWNGPSKGQTYVSYTFRNANNDEVEIGSCPYDYPPKAGTKVWVLYMPDNPARSEIYPFGIDFFRIVA